MTDYLTGQFSICFQSGSNSFKALGSKQHPDKIWDPTSLPFSRTNTDNSGSNYLSFIAADNPAGPAPTIQTSTSNDSLGSWVAYNSGAELRLLKILYKFLNLSIIKNTITNTCKIKHWRI